jgi:dTDP-4-dehydrorhamnose 3,5-epimerase
MPNAPSKDSQTVTPEGKSIKSLIDGVRFKPATTIPDDRGTICEVINSEWEFDELPLVYVYQVTIRPQRVKGWVVHRLQDDRIFFSQGTMRIVLYDDRPESPTYKMLNELFIGEHNRALLRIPFGVYHAVQNVGDTDALFINAPTRPYNHADPDKYRLPLNNDLIPYRFDENRP